MFVRPEPKRFPLKELRRVKKFDAVCNRPRGVEPACRKRPIQTEKALPSNIVGAPLLRIGIDPQTKISQRRKLRRQQSQVEWHVRDHDVVQWSVYQAMLFTETRDDLQIAS